uniref:ER membrane protein complex subunit 10 n=1 Tax=Syphacia muris TaxID=451379 RepID=A0A0N5AWK7_9BILA
SCSFIASSYTLNIFYFAGDEYKPLGTIIVERTVEGNFSGYFVPKENSDELWQGMQTAAKEGHGYSIRTEFNKETFKTFSEPVCVIILPETEFYIQKMEKERQARQHGAQQDNRSWLQKYWLYIVAAFIFVVIMNAATEE